MGESPGQRVVQGMVPGFPGERYVSLTDYHFPRHLKEQWLSAPLMPNMRSHDYFADPVFTYLLQQPYRHEATGYMADDGLRQDLGGAPTRLALSSPRRQAGSTRTTGASSLAP